MTYIYALHVASSSLLLALHATLYSTEKSLGHSNCLWVELNLSNKAIATRSTISLDPEKPIK